MALKRGKREVPIGWYVVGSKAFRLFKNASKYAKSFSKHKRIEVYVEKYAFRGSEVRAVYYDGARVE